MGSMPSGGGGVYGAPPAIVYQSTDPYAPNYKPPTGPQLSPAQKAGQQAKANATPLAEINPDDEEERRRRLALILGSGAETWGGADAGSSGAADAGAGDSSGAADGSAY